MGYAEGLIDSDMVGFGTGGFTDIDYFAIGSFDGGGDAVLSGEDVTEGVPTVSNPVRSEFKPNGMKHMVGQDGDKEVTVSSSFGLVINRSQSQF